MTLLMRRILLLLTLLSLLAMTVGLAAASTGSLFFPYVRKDPSPTPTLTPTPTPTKIPPPRAEIVGIFPNPQPPLKPNEEYVEIRNTTSSSISFNFWTLKPEKLLPTDRYEFPASFVLAPGATVKVWTGFGFDSTTDLYWLRSGPAWNDTHDRAYLKDDLDKVVDVYDY